MKAKALKHSQVPHIWGYIMEDNIGHTTIPYLHPLEMTKESLVTYLYSINALEAIHELDEYYIVTVEIKEVDDV